MAPMATYTQYSLQTVRPRRYSENLNVSVLCPLPPTFGLSRVYDSITLTDKTPIHIPASGAQHSNSAQFFYLKKRGKGEKGEKEMSDI